MQNDDSLPTCTSTRTQLASKVPCRPTAFFDASRGARGGERHVVGAIVLSGVQSKVAVLQAIMTLAPWWTVREAWVWAKLLGARVYSIRPWYPISTAPICPV